MINVFKVLLGNVLVNIFKLKSKKINYAKNDKKNLFGRLHLFVRIGRMKLRI